MSAPVGKVLDLLQEALDLLTDDSSDSCGALDPEVCRTALYVGGEVPLDTCGDGGCSGKDGMVWAQLLSLDPVIGQDNSGKCAAWNFTAQIGVARGQCVGTPPSAANVTADALQQGKDADTILATLRCCDARSEALTEVSLTRWQPVGPSGRCAGGTWTMIGRLDVCC